MIHKKISTEHGEVSSIATVEHTDNGQVVIHIISQLGDAKHEHRITVGSTEGDDLVAALSAEDLKTHLQKHIDEVRSKAASILAGRIKVSKVSAGLV